MNELRIIYIHGFASNGEGQKATYLREYYRGKDTVIDSPTLDPDPRSAIDALCRLVGGNLERGPVVAIGNSLGGFYALVLNARFGIPVFAINPLLRADSLRRHIGANTNLANGEAFEFTAQHADNLCELEREILKPSAAEVHVYLAKDDELIPFADSLTRLPSSVDVSVYEDGGHRFSIFPAVFTSDIEPKIELYRQRQK